MGERCRLSTEEMLFDSVAAKLLPPESAVLIGVKEHRTASVLLLLQRQEKPEVKRRVAVELDIPVIFGLLHPIHFDGQLHTFPLVVC